MHDTRSVRSRLIEAHIQRLEKLSKVEPEPRGPIGYVDFSEEELRQFLAEWPTASPTKPPKP